MSSGRLREYTMRSKIGVEAATVAALGGGGEAEQRAREAGLEDPELPEHALVVVCRGVVALVVDHEPDVPIAHHARKALFVERADGAHEHARVLARPLGAALHRDHARAGERALELVTRLLDQLLSVGEHEHLAPRQARELGEDDGLARARGQAHEQAPDPAAAGGEHCFDGLALVRAQRDHGRDATRT